MILSPAERSYLYESLTQQPPIRPDSRTEFQFRPLEAKASFLPGSNGSGRIRLMDGSECIVSVKAKVVPHAQHTQLIECDIDVSGHRDDLNFLSNLKFNLTSLLEKNFPTESLRLTTKFSFKLYIDCIVIVHSSYPLTLLSLTSYLALKTTKLPLLISDSNDAEIAEMPTFSDDWNNAKLINSSPPIFITLGAIGKNLIFDPSIEEEQVLENALIISFQDGKVITPISNMNLATNSNNSNFKGLNSELVIKSIQLGNKYGAAVIEALDNLLEIDKGEDDSIF